MVVLISHSGVNNIISNRWFVPCLVWNISMRIKSGNLSRRMFSWICPRALRSREFQNISFVASRTCKRGRNPESLLFPHWFHRSRRIKLLRFKGLSFKKRSLQMTVLTEVEADTFRVGHNPCWSENGICLTCVHKRTHRDWISHRQVAWNRVDWTSDYDEWSWLLFGKSDCEIATPLIWN